ncbi:MAG: hypothetical protein RL885_23450 [Planctomycetota bacterium]
MKVSHLLPILLLATGSGSEALTRVVGRVQDEEPSAHVWRVWLTPKAQGEPHLPEGFGVKEELVTSSWEAQEGEEARGRLVTSDARKLRDLLLKRSSEQGDQPGGSGHWLHEEQEVLMHVVMPLGDVPLVEALGLAQELSRQIVRIPHVAGVQSPRFPAVGWHVRVSAPQLDALGVTLAHVAGIFEDLSGIDPEKLEELPLELSSSGLTRLKDVAELAERIDYGGPGQAPILDGMPVPVLTVRGPVDDEEVREKLLEVCRERGAKVFSSRGERLWFSGNEEELDDQRRRITHWLSEVPGVEHVLLQETTSPSGLPSPRWQEVILAGDVDGEAWTARLVRLAGEGIWPASRLQYQIVSGPSFEALSMAIEKACPSPNAGGPWHEGDEWEPELRITVDPDMAMKLGVQTKAVQEEFEWVTGPATRPVGEVLLELLDRPSWDEHTLRLNDGAAVPLHRLGTIEQAQKPTRRFYLNGRPAIVLWGTPESLAAMKLEHLENLRVETLEQPFDLR